MIVVAALVVAAGASLYLLTRPPPIPLTLIDGSTSETLEARFVNYASDRPVFRVYRATTTAKESDGSTSTLSLRLYVGAFYDPYAGVTVDLFALVSGRLDPNLRPSGLTFTANQSGRYAWSYGNGESTSFNNSLTGALIAFPGPVNVTSDQPNLPQIGGTGSSTMTATFQNATASAGDFRFSYPVYIFELDPLGDNAFLGVRATVNGAFAPAIDVGILVHFVNNPDPSADLYATTARSADGAAWLFNVTSAGGVYANATTDVSVVTLDGTPVMSPTPLGSLGGSPYAPNITYTPVTPGSDVVRVGDRITVAAAAYRWGSVLVISANGLVLFEATLG